MRYRPQRGRSRGPWLATTALIALGACAPGAGATEEAPAAAPDNPVVLYVTNNYGAQADIFALGGGSAYRMGTVEPGLTARFVLRQAMIGDGSVEFRAFPANGDAPITSGRLLVFPGAIVDFTLEHQRIHSSATVRP